MKNTRNNTKGMAASPEGDDRSKHPGDFQKVAGYEALHESMMKCVKGVLWKDTPAHYFLNNMDDFILIHEDAEYLLECKARIAQRLRALECQFNTKKTGIIPLSDGILFLGFHYRLTETGKVVMTLNSANIKHERRKMAKLAALERKGERSTEKVDECYNSWKNHASKGDSYKLLQRTDKYVKELRKEESK